MSKRSANKHKHTTHLLVSNTNPARLTLTERGEKGGAESLLKTVTEVASMGGRRFVVAQASILKDERKRLISL
jgi:hypothetical protein